jgi:hypothetical protein
LCPPHASCVCLVHGLKATLRVEVVPDSALQFCSALAKHVRQVFEIVASRKTKLADKVLGSGFKVTIVFFPDIVLGSAKVCIGGDGACAFESYIKELAK